MGGANVAVEGASEGKLVGENEVLCMEGDIDGIEVGEMLGNSVCWVMRVVRKSEEEVKLEK